VEITATLAGLDYELLTQNQTLVDGLTDSVKQWAVDQASGHGHALTKADVAAVDFSRGSVFVRTLLAVPSGGSQGLAQALGNNTAAAATGLTNAVQSVSGIQAAATGAISATVNTVRLAPSQSTSSVTALPPAAPDTTTEPLPDMVCEWDLVGDGHCSTLYGSDSRLSSWVQGGPHEARTACCGNLGCAGFYLDKEAPAEYVILRDIGTPDGVDPGRRECWRKVSPAYVDPLSAAPARALPVLLLASIAVGSAARWAI